MQTLTKIRTSKLTNNSVVHFPIKRINHVKQSYDNTQKIKEYISNNDLKHIYLNLTNFVVDELPHNHNITEIIETSIDKNTIMSIELPNDKCLGGRYNPELDKIVTKKYNKNKVNIFKVYHLNDKNSLYMYNVLSNDIKTIPRNQGIHLKMDNIYIDTFGKTKFVQCCSLALSNCYDHRKNTEVIIEVNNRECLHSIASYLCFYGMDMYYKVKLIQSPLYTISNNMMGFHVLDAIPFNNNWLGYFGEMVLEKDVH
jgi:hypothetical protein